MKLELYTDVVLTCDVPEHRLKRGDIVKPMEHHIAADGTEGYSIEVFNAAGDTIAVTAVPSLPSNRFATTKSSAPGLYPISGCLTPHHLLFRIRGTRLVGCRRRRY